MAIGEDVSYTNSSPECCRGRAAVGLDLQSAHRHPCALSGLDCPSEGKHMCFLTQSLLLGSLTKGSSRDGVCVQGLLPSVARREPGHKEGRGRRVLAGSSPDAARGDLAHAETYSILTGTAPTTPPYPEQVGSGSRLFRANKPAA